MSITRISSRIPFPRAVPRNVKAQGLSNRPFVRLQSLTTVPLNREIQRLSQQDPRGRKLALLAAASPILGVAFFATREKKETLDQCLARRGSVLDLSRTKLSEDELEKLSTFIKDKPHRFMRIVWGKQNHSNQELRKTIDEALREKRDAFEERPTPYICTKFCKLAYMNEEALRQPSALPNGWEVLLVHDRAKEDGYFGAAFVNHKTGQIVLAHRGTSELFHDLQTDAIAVLGGVMERQIESALRFTQVVLREVDTYGYRLGFVGHSLGGWLAQLTSSFSTSKGYRDLYVVTLDTPGAKEVVSNLFSENKMMPALAVDQEKIDFTHYLSYPNVVNTCNTQIGDVFHILPDLPAWGTMNRVKYWGMEWVSPSLAYLLKTHSSDAQCGAFDSETGMPRPKRIYKALNWPSLQKMGKHYYSFFSLTKDHVATLPDVDNLSLQDQYLVRHLAQYNVREAKEDEIGLSHFSSESLGWLKQLREEERRNPGHAKQIEEQLGLPNGTVEEFLACELDDEEQTLRVTLEGVTPWEYRNRLARLLKTYPELLYAEEEITPRAHLLLSSSLTKDFIYFCETAVTVRLYLYDPAPKSECERHTAEIEKIDKQIIERKELLHELGKGKWSKVLNTHLSQLEMMREMHELLLAYKKKEFNQAQARSDNLLSRMDKYPDPDLHIARLKAGVYSIRAKIARSVWQSEKDLKESEKNYQAALEELPEVASLASNYGALLNNWGEWLFWEGRYDEAIEKHREALSQHEKAHELSKQAEWLYVDERFQNYEEIHNAGVKRDFGRALFLLAQAEYERKKIIQEEYHKRLKEALLFFSTEVTDPLKIPAVTHLFKGIIYSALGDLEKALSFFEDGLKKQANHPSLLNRRSELLLLQADQCAQPLKGEKLQASLEDARSALTEFQKKKATERTPEDRHRIKVVQDRIAKLEKKLGANT